MNMGDANTKLFHQFSYFRRKNYVVWDIKNEREDLITRQRNMEEAHKFFKQFYEDVGNHSMLINWK